MHVFVVLKRFRNVKDVRS